MSLARIKARVPSAVRRVGRYTLKEHDLRFHMASKDGSGKCDAFFTGNSSDFVMGALFHIDPKHKVHLDKAEGLGFSYREKVVKVIDQSNQSVEATMYIALKTQQGLIPYSWYLNHVLIGAKETGLPLEYIRKIEHVDSEDDEDLTRNKKELGIHKKDELRGRVHNSPKL